MRHPSDRLRTFLLILLTIPLLPALVQSAELRITPATATVPIGSTASISLALSSATDLAGFQARIGFDANILEVTDMTINNGFNRLLKKNVNNITGQLWLAALSLAAPSVSGADVPLATVTFKVKGVGTSNLLLSSAQLGTSSGEETAVTLFSAAVTSTGESTAPVVDTFTLPPTYSSLTVPILALTGHDNVAVTGYMITESATAPTAADQGWSMVVPESHTFDGIPVGVPTSKTLYAWVKDASGNVSAGLPAGTIITIIPPGNVRIAGTTPTYYATLFGAYQASKDGEVIELKATTLAEDFIADRPVTVILSGGRDTLFNPLPADFTVLQGKISLRNGTVKMQGIRILSPPAQPDITPPQVSLTVPAPTKTLVVSLVVTASDDRGVTGYLLSESSQTPANDDPAWSSTSPATFTFSSFGDKSLYAFARDAAGNIGSTSSQFSLTPVLTLQLAGNGAGMVTSTPAGIGGISCMSGSDLTGCDATFPKGQNIDLTPFAGIGSAFTQWGGNCNGNTNANGTYSLILNTSCTTIAGFASAPYVRIGSTSFTSLQVAYDKAQDGDLIMLLEGALPGQFSSLSANRAINIRVGGGYGPAFIAPALSESVLHGVVTVTNGTVRMEHIKISP
jgi:hypothetical protein